MDDYCGVRNEREVGFYLHHCSNILNSIAKVDVSHMPNFELIETFITVVEKHSFSQAARALSISRALVSMRIKRLEQEIGVTLLVRDTRKNILTEAGQELYVQFKDILLSITQSIENIRKNQVQSAGILRVASTYEFGHQMLWPLLSDFCHQHPQLHLQCLFDARPYDLIHEQIDVAIRLGQLNDSSYKARKLTEYETLLVASPQYLAGREYTTAEQLEHCDWISNLNLNTSQSWQFFQGQQQVTLYENSKYAANNIQTIKQMLLDGLGIAVIPQWMVINELADGRLVQLFTDYQMQHQGVYAVFPNQVYIPLKTRLLIDFLASQWINY